MSYHVLVSLFSHASRPKLSDHSAGAASLSFFDFLQVGQNMQVRSLSLDSSFGSGSGLAMESKPAVWSDKQYT